MIIVLFGDLFEAKKVKWVDLLNIIARKLCRRNLGKLGLFLQMERYTSFMKRRVHVNGWLKKKPVMNLKLGESRNTRL